MSEVTARPIEEHEYDEWVRVESAAFGGFPDEHSVELERRLVPIERNLAAFLGEDLIGTAASYAFEMTVPGGTTIPVSGLTAVGALGTHRRRGALRAMMELDLDAAAARGELASILNASESSIYGRFGYGVAQEYQTIRIAASRAAFAHDPPPRTLRLVVKQEAKEVVPALFDAYRLTRAGEVSRPVEWWDGVLGETETWKGGGKIFVVVADAVSDDPGGYVIYTLEDQGPGIVKKMVVRELVAATTETDAALWRYCFELDLVGTVEVTARPVDDSIRWRLTEPRQLEVTRQCDFVWVRLLDITGGLAARAYGAEGEIVFELRDAFRPENDGAYRLAGSPKGGECGRTSASPDLELSIADLGALYLGGVRASTLAQAGRITEVRPGALDLADDLFGWSVAPMCMTRF